MKSGRGSGNALSITRRPVKAVTCATNAGNARQKLVKQVKRLVGAVSIQTMLIKDGLIFASAVRSPQRCVKHVRELLGAICVP